jgi:glycerophosphoryl diester phosphodiesterase
VDIEIPSWLQWLAYLAGSQWPTGSETGMWRIAGYWRSAAGELEALIPDLQRVRSETQTVLTGDTAAAAEQQFAMLFDGDYSVPKLVEAMRAIGDLADNLGTEIQYTKLQIITTLAIAAASIYWAIANADWTFGGSLAEIPIAEEVAEQSIGQLVKMTLARIESFLASKLGSTLVPRLLVEGAVSAGIGAGQEVTIEGLQVLEGHRDGIDVGQVLDSAFTMGVAGVTGGLVGHGVGEFLGKDGSIPIRVVKGAVTGLSSAEAANVAATLAGGGDLGAATFLGGAIGFVHGGVHGGSEPGHAGGADPAESSIPPGTIDESKVLRFEKQPDGIYAWAEDPANDVVPPANAAASPTTTAEPTVANGDRAASSPPNALPTAADPPTRSSDVAGRAPIQDDQGQGTRSPNGTPAAASIASPTADRVKTGPDLTPMSNARLESRPPEGTLDPSLTAPTPPIGHATELASPPISETSSSSAGALAAPRTAAPAPAPTPAASSDRGTNSGPTSPTSETRAGLADSNAGNSPSQPPATPVAHIAETTAAHADSSTKDPEADRIAAAQAGETPGRPAEGAAGRSGPDGSTLGRAEGISARPETGRSAGPATSRRDSTRPEGPSGARPGKPGPLRRSGVTHDPLAAADAIGMVGARNEEGHSGSGEGASHARGVEGVSAGSGDGGAVVVREALALRVPPVGVGDLVHPLGDARLGEARARANAAWWGGLSDGQREALIKAHPREIGNAEGIPAAARHEANSLVVQRYLEYRDSLQSRHYDGMRLTDAQRAFITRMRNMEVMLGTAQRAANKAGVGGPYLLAFDPLEFGGDGRAIVSFGDDPYRAESVSWNVPGLMTTIDQLDLYMQQALNHLGSTLREEPGLSAASIAYVGYDAPNDSASWRVAGQRLAREGGEILYSDIKAFNAARDAWAGDGSHFDGNHVFGHSYGSTTVGFAGRGGRLGGEVRSVTLMGSPGVGPIEHAREFGVGENVFVAASSRDAVTALGGRVGGVAGRIFGRGLGVDPAMDFFGAQRVTSEFPAAMDHRHYGSGGTHSLYRAPVGIRDGVPVRSESLANFGRIAAGHPERVDHEEHRTLIDRPGNRLRLRSQQQTHEPAIGRPLRLADNPDAHPPIDKRNPWNPRWHTNAPTDLPQPLADCAHRVTGQLSARYGRDFHVDVEPTPSGVPARAVFEAANSGSEFASYAKVKEKLESMEPRSSAIVASRWKDPNGPASGHIFLAVNDGGDVKFVNEDGEKFPWPPPWGEHEVLRTAVGYLDEHGNPLHRLDETQGRLVAADAVGDVHGQREHHDDQNESGPEPKPPIGAIPDPAGVLGLEDHSPGTLSEAETSAAYAHGEARLREFHEQLIRDGVSAEDRARTLFELRRSLRSLTRDLMENRAAADLLETLESNPTFEDLVAKQEARGLVGDQVYDAIIDTATRSHVQAETLTAGETTAVYTQGERRIRELNEQLVADGVSAEDRARTLSDLRRSLRRWTRALMENQTAADMLAGLESDPTFEDLVAKHQARGLAGDEVYDAIIDTATRSHYALSTLSDEETRTVYTQGELRMRELKQQLIDEGRSPEDIARTMYEMRRIIRTWTRELMHNRPLADWLNENESNPTFEQLVEKNRVRGLEGDDIYQAIIDSSTRSRASVNDSLGIDPERPPELPPMRGPEDRHLLPDEAAIEEPQGAEPVGSQDSSAVEPVANCAYEVVDDLSARYGREFRIGVEPGPRGVPARALFEAVRSGAKFASYAEIHDELAGMEPGSSAVLASRWAEGGEKQGGHAYLAVNENGVVRLRNLKTGESEGWPPAWGEGAVSRTAVAYLDEHGDPVPELRDNPDRSAADAIGDVRGLRDDPDFLRRQEEYRTQDVTTRRVDVRYADRLGDVLDASDPAKVRQLAKDLSGVYGPYRIELKGEKVGGEAILTGKVFDGEREIGRIQQRFDRDRTGKLVVYHTGLEIDEERFRGKGFSKALVSKMDRYYIDSGVDRVESHTHAKGAYAAARRGEIWDPHRLQRSLDAIKDSASRLRHTFSNDDQIVIDQLLERLEPDHPRLPALIDIAELGTPDTPDLGRQLLDGIGLRQDGIGLDVVRYPGADAAVPRGGFRAWLRRVFGSPDDPASPSGQAAHVPADPHLAAAVDEALSQRIPPVGVDELVNPLGDASAAVERARANAAWWDGLSDEQQHLLIEAHPDKIGNAEGIPAWARHEANTRSLDERLAYRDRLQAKRDNGEHLSHAERRDLRRTNRIDNALREARETARTRGMPDPYLLAFDPEAFDGHGRAIVSFGEDPYRALSVSWYLDGLAMPIDRIHLYLRNALGQLESTLREEPGLSAASIAYIGYETPHGWRSWRVAGPKFAQIGGQVLFSDISAFNAAHDAWTGDGSHFSGNHVVALSYGSTTAGYAGEGGRLGTEVRTVSLLGSPGVGPIRDASGFGIGADNVFVASSSRDGVTQLGGATPRSIGRILRRGLGVDPAMDFFGAQRVTAEFPTSMDRYPIPGIHMSYHHYVDRGAEPPVRTESLANFGRIAAGHPERVDHEEHRSIVHRFGLSRTHEPAVGRSLRITDDPETHRTNNRRWWDPRWHTGPHAEPPRPPVVDPAADAPGGLDPSGGPTGRPGDSIERVAQQLSWKYDREIPIVSEPDTGPVTPGKLLNAVGSDRLFATYDEVGDTLGYLGRDSSAIVASDWTDRPGTDVVLAVNIGGTVHYYDYNEPSAERLLDWPPSRGEGAVSRMAVGYLDAHGKAVVPLDEYNERFLDVWQQEIHSLAMLSEADRLQLENEKDALKSDFASALQRGVAPGSDEANALAERDFQLRQRLAEDYSYEVHRYDGRRLVTDAEFRDPYESFGPGSARYARDVIVANAERHLEPPEDPDAPRPVGPGDPGNTPGDSQTAGGLAGDAQVGAGGSDGGDDLPGLGSPDDSAAWRVVADEALALRWPDEEVVGPDDLVVPLGQAEWAAEWAHLNALWWRGLTEHQQNALVQTYPEQIGHAEGVSVAARHEANSLVLQRVLEHRDQLQSRVDNGTQLIGREAVDLVRLNVLAEAVDIAVDGAAQAGVGGPYLLELDADGVGRAIVAFGDNPLEAQSVSWHVPGAGATIDGLGSSMGVALEHLQSTLEQEPGLSACSIAWIGYDPMAEGGLRVGGEYFYSDLRGFNASRDAWSSDLSHFANNHVFGHDYGAAVVGYAGEGGRLAGEVHSVTLIDAPGAGPIRHAGDFGVGDNVYVATAEEHPSEMGDPAPGSDANGPGVDPAMESFGAQRITGRLADESDPASNQPNDLLTQLGRIAAARSEQIPPTVEDVEQAQALESQGETAEEPSEERDLHSVRQAAVEAAADVHSADMDTSTGRELESGTDVDPGERWRAVPAGIDPTGRLAAHALTKWETPLNSQAIERLLDGHLNAAEAVHRAQADARVWTTLTGIEQRALIDKFPEFIGNGLGFPTEARYEANSVTLERCQSYRDGLLSKQRRGKTLSDGELKFVANMGKVDETLNRADRAAGEAGIAKPQLLNFDRHWRVVLCYGERPLEAKRVWLLVDRRAQHSQGLPAAVLDRLRSIDNDEAWIDWSPPNHDSRQNAAAQRAGFGESPLYREIMAWSAARRAWATDDSHPAAPQVHWVSDSAMPPGRDPARLRNPDGDMAIVGHRGARHDRPENTWASAKLALEQGADAVEGDTQMTRDRHLVNLHDGKVDRTSTGTGRIADMRLAEATEFDYGAKHTSAKLGDAQGDTGLLKWEELLRNVRDYPRPVKAVIELKHPSKFGGEVEQELVRLLKRLQMDSATSAEDTKAVVISFWPDALRRVWQAAPGVPTVLLLDSRESSFSANLAAAKWAHASAIGPHVLSLRARPDLVAKAADAGLGVLAHGLGKFSKGSVAAEGHAAEFCASIGVDAVITNEPGWVVSVLRPESIDHAGDVRPAGETRDSPTQHHPDADPATESVDRDPGERWRDVPAGIDPTGRLAAKALAKWDRPRTPKVIERLLLRQGDTEREVQQTQADARSWPRLTGAEQRALIDHHHWFIGNRIGFPTEARYEANSASLELGRSIRDRLLAQELAGETLTDAQLKFVAQMGKVDEALHKATEAAREAGIAEPRIWAFDRHWRLVLSGGDPLKASRVLLLADPKGPLPDFEHFSPAVLDQLRAAGRDPDTAWIAWSEPNREPRPNAAARRVRLGESALYRDFADLTAARRAWASEGTDPTVPRVHWASDPATTAGRRALALERKAVLREPDGGMLVVGHRGAPLDRPELTRAGYELALAHGAGGVEGDVAMTLDQHLVNFHDSKVDRTSTGTGRVAKMTLAQLREFDYGTKHSSARLGDDQGDTGLVLWEELLGLVHDHPRPTVAVIETKRTPYGAAVERELVRLLNRFDMASPTSPEQARAVVVSKWPDSLRRVRQAAPNVPTALILGGGPESLATAKLIGAWAVTINIAELRARPDLVERAAEQGLAVICAARTTSMAEVRAGMGEVGFGATLRRDAEYCQSLGVDAITVNNPGEVVSWLHLRDS